MTPRPCRVTSLGYLVAMPNARLRFVGLVASVLGFGCASDVSVEHAGGATTGTGVGTGGQGGEAYVGVGSVFASSTDSTASHGSNAGALFSTNGTAPGSKCTEADEGACHVHACTYSDEAAVSAKSAGTITITGGAYPVVLSPQADNRYASSDSQQGLFAGGETIHFAVSGAGDIPPFDTSLVAPSPVTVASPELSHSLWIDRTKDFTTTWSGGHAGDEVYVTLMTMVTDATMTKLTKGVVLTCGFDALAGTGTIPATSLGKLLPTGSLSSDTVEISVASYANVVAGGWRTTFRLDRSGTTPTGAPASGSVITQ